MTVITNLLLDFSKSDSHSKGTFSSNPVKGRASAVKYQCTGADDAIVIDTGSSQWRIGFASQNEPLTQFEPVTHRMPEGNWLVGSINTHSLSSRPLSSRSPYDESQKSCVLTQQSVVERLLDHSFSLLTPLFPKDGSTKCSSSNSLGNTSGSNTATFEGIGMSLVMTEVLGNPPAARKELNELLFECYKLPRLLLVHDVGAASWESFQTGPAVAKYDSILPDSSTNFYAESLDCSSYKEASKHALKPGKANILQSLTHTNTSNHVPTHCATSISNIGTIATDLAEAKLNGAFDTKTSFEKVTLLAVMVGNCNTRIVAVLDGSVIATRRINYGGSLAAENLLRMLQLKYPSFPARITLGQVREMYEASCQVSRDYPAQMEAISEACSRRDYQSVVNCSAIAQFPYTQETEEERRMKEAARAALAEKRRELGEKLKLRAEAAKVERLVVQKKLVFDLKSFYSTFVKENRKVSVSDTFAASATLPVVASKDQLPPDFDKDNDEVASYEEQDITFDDHDDEEEEEVDDELEMESLGEEFDEMDDSDGSLINNSNGQDGRTASANDKSNRVVGSLTRKKKTLTAGQIKVLKENGYKDLNDLRETLEEAQNKLNRLLGITVASDKKENVDYSLLAKADSDLSAQELMQKRRLRLLKAGADARERQAAEKAQREERQREKNALLNEKRQDDFEGWAADLYAERSRILNSMRLREREQNALNDRRSGATSARLRNVVSLVAGEDDSDGEDGAGGGSANKNSKRPRNGKANSTSSKTKASGKGNIGGGGGALPGEESSFGDGQSDWDIYRDISMHKDDDEDALEEEVRQQKRLAEIESQLEEFDANRFHQVSLSEDQSLTNVLNILSNPVKLLAQVSHQKGPLNPPNTAAPSPAKAVDQTAAIDEAQDEARYASQITLCTERYSVPEGLFTPATGQAGLVEVIEDILRIISPEAASKLASNIFVTGPSAAIPGLSQRLLHDLSAICPVATPISINLNCDPYLSWKGAARLARQSSTGSNRLNLPWITREWYLENGPDRIIPFWCSNQF